MIAALLLASVPQAASTPDVERPEVESLVRVDLDAGEVAKFHTLDLDVADIDAAAGTVDIVADADDLELLERAGFRHAVVIEDLVTYYAERSAASDPTGGPYGQWLNPIFGQGSMGGFYPFSEVESVLDQLHAQYPNITTQKASIGQTIEGRDIWMMKISDNPGVDENEPEVRMDAMHHAREPQGMQSTLWFMLFLLEEYGTDPLADYLVDEREHYFILCVNPDGYVYNQQIAPNGGGMWRKNRRDNGDNTFGVDLNRNYPYQWGYDNSGSSPNTSSSTYRGTAPMSEPEVAAMVAFIAGRDFGTALSVHTFGDWWLSPWGYESIYPANFADYNEIGNLATAVNNYPFGTAWELLYEANGVTIDYDHGQHSTFSWTPEIGSSSDGFWPQQSQIVPLAEENLRAMQVTALAGGAFVNLTGLDLVDAGDGDGSYEPGEPVEITAHLRNSGTAASGAVDVSLTSTSSDVMITTSNSNVGAIASFADGQNATPLRLEILPGATVGTLVPITITVTYEGLAQDFDAEILVGTEVTLALYDFEAVGDEGWAVGPPNDATTGEWTRVDPLGTAAQPEDDHTPTPGTICWVTGQGTSNTSVGENDVDNGSTTLVSPVFDLAGKAFARISYWRWYSNDEGSAPNTDVFQIDLSNDGGASWVLAELIGPTGPESSGGWFEASLDVESILTPTDQMRIRFVASDLGSGSIVEAAIDDLSVTYIDNNCQTPTSYCIAAPNSTGFGALMSWLGSTDVTDDDFTLVATSAVPSEFGLFFYGATQAQIPAGNGFVCIGGTLFRLPAVQADAFGTASHQVDFGNLPSGGNIANGDTFNFQFWYRDPGVGSNYNFSDGLEVEFCAD